MDKSYLLSAINPLISTTLFVTFFFLWFRQKEKKHVFYWALAYACAAIGSSVEFTRAFVDDAGVVSFVANVFFLGVAFFAVRGAIIRHSTRAFVHHIIAIYIAAVVAGLWFAFVNPSVVLRGLATSACAAAMFIIAASVIRRNDELDWIDHLTTWAFLISAATLLGRPTVSYLYEGPLQADAQLAGSFWIVSFKIFAMLSWFACAILFLLRITTDLMKELSTQSLTDPLTGLLNRRGFFGSAEPLIRQSTPALPVVLAICDIDRFKRVNDTYGHRTGDCVIQRFADLLQESANEAGCVVGRLGGEEFVVLFPRTNLAAARAFAESLRGAFAAMAYESIPSSDTVTVSIGIAERFEGEDPDSLIERADGALYRAKRGGRNRVDIAAPMRRVASAVA